MERLNPRWEVNILILHINKIATAATVLNTLMYKQN